MFHEFYSSHILATFIHLIIFGQHKQDTLYNFFVISLLNTQINHFHLKSTWKKIYQVSSFDF